MRTSACPKCDADGATTQSTEYVGCATALGCATIAYWEALAEFRGFLPPRKIGSGAFGDIFKCRWRGTLVAAKLLKHPEQHSEVVERMAALADLKQEIGLLGQLRHPNICLLLGYSLANGREVLTRSH